MSFVLEQIYLELCFKFSRPLTSINIQAGFALVEVGTVSMKNTKNILVKNLLDACIGCMSFYVIGFAFAFGGDNGFIGKKNML